MLKARDIAVTALCKVNNDLAYSNITLNNILKSSDLSKEDKAFATALFYGVLDRKITLDYVLEQSTKTPFKRVKPFTAEVLRVALYQIMYMDKVPSSAAVNEAVKQIKSSKEGYNSGFVNGVLRNIIRGSNSLPKGSDSLSLSVRYSCPEWIINEFINDYGTDTAVALLEASLETPPVTMRVNTQKTDKMSLQSKLLEKGIETNIVPSVEALNLIGNNDIEGNEAYKLGLFHIQDLSSQYAINELKLKDGERVLDMCAAPGGKTFTMAECVGKDGEIVSCDIHEKRVSLIKEGAKRLGLENVKTVVCDAMAFDNSLGLFDAVLCDVPCSGLGIIRRKPDIKYKPQTDFFILQKTQKEILNNAVNYLKSTGRIMYSTCTVRKKENKDIVKAFLEEHKEFRVLYEYTFMPQNDRTDGFYAAVLGR